ncbi:pectin acetylesterase 7-like isoform X2 [Salvia miltiorrhiza]|uniref:pectin acetylesterase 7-like isoform X2 n=1 Tax=Salvia miltiorrhiza TaxID=226208 RepID=UPI0025AD2209|nr:pectin acetylesterase 7-like isoform X2 [Salvia miltiorrhiza]
MAAQGFVFCALLLLIAHHVGADEVPFTEVVNAYQRNAVCLDGSAAGYHLASGYGDGAKNWIVYLKGGGWCEDNQACQRNKTTSVGSSRGINFVNLTGILNQSPDVNPDFYNWNRVYVIYCDQASFLGDSSIGQGVTQLDFRGSRIYDAVIDDLLAKGMNCADNAILAGRSAGGLATILHCDEFRARLPNASRVKCISDAGFFIRASDLPNADFRQGFYASIIKFHNISSFLPRSCTERIDSNLCLFPEYFVGDVQTPLFLLNSAFDFYQLQNNLVPQTSPDWEKWNKGLGDLQNCPDSQKQLIKDFGMTFLNAIMEIPDNPSRGLFIYPCLTHTVTTSSSDKQSTIDVFWNPNSTVKLENMTILEAVSNWYFDRGSIKLIESLDFPQYCYK